MEQNQLIMHAPTQRLEAIDIFRGLTIAAMILVNNPGSWSHVYAPLLHAKWHGCTPTDLVFPFFLFAVGTVIPFSLGSAANQANKPYRKIASRALIIFGLGLFMAAFPRFGLRADTPPMIQLFHYLSLTVFSTGLLFRAVFLSYPQPVKAKKWAMPLLLSAGLMLLIGWWYYDLSTLRIPGVLQRIAIVYLITALLYLWQSPKGLLGTGIALLLLYWGLMTLVPVPGGIAPNLEPETNLGAWLDRNIFGTHLWVQSKTWDPEGLLSTLPAVVSGIIGVFAGVWLKKAIPVVQKIKTILGTGLVLVALGYAWGQVFPINKQLWTSSYVLYTGGIALLVLGAVLLLADYFRIRKWAIPFRQYGMNALFVFVVSGLSTKLMLNIRWAGSDGNTTNLRIWLYENLFHSWLSDYPASLAFALTNVLVLYLLASILYQKKIFIKV